MLMRTNATRGMRGTVRRVVLVAALAICTTAAFSLVPLAYSQFSWQALGQPYAYNLMVPVMSTWAHGVAVVALLFGAWFGWYLRRQKV